MVPPSRSSTRSQRQAWKYDPSGTRHHGRRDDWRGRRCPWTLTARGACGWRSAARRKVAFAPSMTTTTRARRAGRKRLPVGEGRAGARGRPAATGDRRRHQAARRSPPRPLRRSTAAAERSTTAPMSLFSLCRVHESVARLAPSRYGRAGSSSDFRRRWLALYAQVMRLGGVVGPHTSRRSMRWVSTRPG